MKGYSVRLRSGAAVGALALLLSAGAANAQSETAPEAARTPPPQEPAADDIVVTGTLIRGAAPVGSNLISLGSAALVSTGATSSNELLATIPQVTNYFNSVPSADLSIAVNQIQVSRPNLRNISPRNAASSATLIMVDGHRIATVGVRQASVDPDVIPTGAIERVEVVTEGGSATYGADAVAGVINFITRKRFDGVKADARYGFADNYWQVDANLTAGKDWGSGSAYLSYTFAKNDALFGRDRDFIRGLDYAKQPYVGRGRECDAPNVAIVTTFSGIPISQVNYAYPALTPNTFNACDESDNSTVVPASERHGAVASLYQELSDATKATVRAFYSRRETQSMGVMNGTVNMRAGNPYYQLPPGVSPPPPGLGQNQAVSFSFAPVLGLASAPSGTLTEEWGVNAELEQELGGGWQARGLFNFSRSNSQFYAVGVSDARLAQAGAATTLAGAINPYDIAKTANQALIADLIDNEIAGQAKDELLNLRAIVSGPLFKLPGGDLSVAVGYEYMHDGFQQRYESEIRRGTLRQHPFSAYRRRVHSVFGEARAPIFGEDNAIPGFQSLVLSASARYDDYSDFGDTFNPKAGVTWKPAAWLSLRGNWGTSFTAPTPLDQLGSLRNTLDAFPFVAFQRPGDVLPGGVTCCMTLGLQGSRPNLRPQTADTWSVGLDVEAPFASGLRASASYYSVKFKNILSTPTPNVAIFTNFPNNVLTSVTGLTAAQLAGLRDLAANAGATIDSLPAGRPVYEFVDFRTGNFGVLKVSGIDFSVNWRQETGFGGFDLGVNGNYLLTRKSQVSATAPVVNDLATENSRLQLQAMAGVNLGGLRAQATWNHSAGYAITPTTSTPVQSRVKAFNTVNLFFKYDIGGESALTKDLSLTLNVNNVLDQDPPLLLRNDQNENGYANGFTLGRMFILGVSKAF